MSHKRAKNVAVVKAAMSPTLKEQKRIKRYCDRKIAKQIAQSKIDDVKFDFLFVLEKLMKKPT